MSNAAGTKASREEEIAYLVVEQILGVDIHLADAGAGNKKPDGAWTYPDGRRGVVEVTSPPDKKLMKRWAQAKREGTAQAEGGSIPVRWDELDQVCTEMLASDWGRGNVDKLRGEPADERHLFLFGRSYRYGSYFYRLSDEYEEGQREHVADLDLPESLTDVWFRGRASREEPYDTKIWVARFQSGSGWHRYVVDIDERHLPSPESSIADDRIDPSLRTPKDRSVSPTEGAHPRSTAGPE